MKKKLALLLAGAMTLSILLSACGSAAEDSSADIADTPAPSASAEPAGTLESKEPATVSAPSAEPSEEPSEAPESAEPSQAVVQTAAPTQNPAVVNTPAPSTSAPVADTPQPTPEPSSAQPAATKEAALIYVGQSVSSLIAAIGQPNSRSYAPSCLGDGEDGELIYNDFTVYTYREGSVETVEDVM